MASDFYLRHGEPELFGYGDVLCLAPCHKDFHNAPRGELFAGVHELLGLDAGLVTGHHAQGLDAIQALKGRGSDGGLYKGGGVEIGVRV